jgi:4-hydroxybenzoate polyprenyltransferase
MKYLIYFAKLSRFKVVFFDFFWLLTLVSLFTINFKISILDFLLGVLVSLSVILFGFAINDVEDADDDVKDEKKKKRNVISNGELSKSFAWKMIALTIALPLMLSLIFFGIYEIILVTLALIAGYGYSSKRLRWKSIAFLDFLSHGFFLSAFQIILFILIASVEFGIKEFVIVIGAWIFSIGGCIYNQVRDFEVDKLAKLKNTTQTFGLATGKILFIGGYSFGTILFVLGLIMNFA